MQPINTRGYVYKTDLHSIYAKTQKRNLGKIKDFNKMKKRKHDYDNPKHNNNKKNLMSFEKILLESIDESLFILGDSGKQVVYSHLENTLKMKKKDIPYRIEEFTGAIEDIFKTGANLIEIQIMKCLFKRVGKSFKNKSEQTKLKFLEYLARIKQEKEKQRKSSNYSQTREI